MSDFMSAPCQHCPFRRDVKPFLHPERAEEIALTAESMGGSFICHKTLERDEDEGELLAGENSKECAGALYMKKMAQGATYYDDEGFEPKADWDCYEDSYEMHEAYQEEWESKRGAA